MISLRKQVVKFKLMRCLNKMQFSRDCSSFLGRCSGDGTFDSSHNMPLNLKSFKNIIILLFTKKFGKTIGHIVTIIDI